MKESELTASLPIFKTVSCSLREGDGYVFDRRVGLPRTGNWCGHDPVSPRFYDKPQQHKPRPKILVWAGEAWSRFYHAPGAYFDTIRNQRRSSRRQRSESREALSSIAQVILHYTELASLRVGIPYTTNGFKSLTIEFLAEKAGIGLKRAERAIALMKRAGYIRLIERFNIKDERFIGLAAVKSLTPDFFKACGIDLRALSAQRRLARKRINKKRSAHIQQLQEASASVAMISDFVMPKGSRKAHMDCIYKLLSADERKQANEHEKAMVRRRSFENVRE